MKRMMARVAAAAIALCTGTAAMAGDDNGNFMIRLQGTGLITQESTNSLRAPSADLKAGGHKATVSDEFLPTATLTYFFNRNVALELFCCFANADVGIKGPLANGNIANVWMFPPALTLQYHFTGMGAFKPYVGVGAQYIAFFSEDTGKNAIGAGGVKFDDAFGPTIQAGFDLGLGNGWYLNADVKKSWLETTAKWSNVSALSLGSVTGKVDLDPLIVSAGIGYRFNLEDLFGRRSAAPLK